MMKRTLKYATLIIFVALALILLCACADTSVEKGDIVARISGDSVTVSAAFTEQIQHAHEGKTIYLFELAPGESVSDLNSKTPAGEAAMAESISFSLPMNDSGATRLCYAFVIATFDAVSNSYSPMHQNPVYISNPEALASDKSGAPEYFSIKGVNGESLTAALELGASHAVINLPIEDYLLTAGGNGEYRHEFSGESFFFDSAKLSALEKKLSVLDAAECAVYLRIYLGSSYEKLDAAKRFLSYPEADGGEFYQINFGDKRAVGAYSAFVDLLAVRYPSVRNIIVGRAQNSPELGADSADISSGAYVSEYAAALRITHNILRSHRSGSQVYAAIDRYITVPKSAGLMSAESFLSSIAGKAKGQEDYDWGVAAECAPAIFGSDSVWYDNESNATLSPTNLSYFTDELLGRDELLWGGWIRPLIISDFSVGTVKDNPASEAKQSASYAYTYYAAAMTGKIRALVYSLVYDTENTTDGLISASGEKEIYSMVRRIDTDASIGDEVGELIGNEWTALYTNEEIRKRVVRGKYSKGTAEIKGTEGYELSPVILFEDGTLSGFDVLDGGYVSLVRKNGKSVLCADFAPQNGQVCSVAAQGVASGHFGGDYLAIPLKIVPSGDAAVQNYSLTLTLIQSSVGSETAIYTSSVSVAPNNDSVAMFDISGFSKTKTGSSVTVVLTVDPADGTPFELTVEKLVLAKENSNTALIVVLVIAGVLVLGGLVTLFIFWFRKNYTFDFGGKKHKKSKKK